MATDDREYAFDVKLFATVRVKAISEEVARSKLKNYTTELDISMMTPDGVTFTTASEDGEADLVEIDGEPT